MFLWKAKSMVVMDAMTQKGFESSTSLGRTAQVDKTTMGKVMNNELVKQYILERIAEALGVEWRDLQEGHVFVRPGPKRGKRSQGDGINREVVDALEAFASLTAYRTKVNPDEVRCLAYLFDKEKPGLTRLGAFTGRRAFDDKATLIPCSGKPKQTEEEKWYIISRAFSCDEYVCDDVDWDLAIARGFVTAREIWPDLRGVAACPMRPRSGDVAPLGVVCVDVAQSVDENGWRDNIALQRTLESLGGILCVMVENRGLHKKRR